MPLQINRVDAEVDVLPTEPGGGGRPPVAGGPGDRALKERLRPIVLEILDEELERLRRRLG